jgi:hypothetical protein
MLLSEPVDRTFEGVLDSLLVSSGFFLSFASLALLNASRNFACNFMH